MTDGTKDHTTDPVSAGVLMTILRETHDVFALACPMEAR